MGPVRLNERVPTPVEPRYPLVLRHRYQLRLLIRLVLRRNLRAVDFLLASLVLGCRDRSLHNPLSDFEGYAVRRFEFGCFLGVRHRAEGQD